MDRFEDAKLRIKEATDLVALIESYLPLKPRGRNLIALCPFHAENSPSFNVSREKQFYKCFGCGKTGDVFTWMMEREGLTFREAMEVLADRAGISLEGVWKGGRDEVRKGPDSWQVLAEVAAYFQSALSTDEGQLGLAYLRSRGLAPAIEPWRLGYHPRHGALQRAAQERRWPREVLEDAGLLKNGREPLQGRVMFPIEDERGRTVGFGGRLIPGAPGSEGDGDYKPPKYLNSPESAIFNKRRVLFGLHKAKAAGQRRLVVMEGYTDVIACHLAGFQGAVASLGTAFTQDHARIVERYATDGLVLMFDGDRAGVQAAERALRELINARVPVRIALMSEAGGGIAKDPADVVTARPGEDPELVVERRARFADVLDGAEEMLAVWFRLLRRRLDLSQTVHLETAATECAALLGRIDEPVRQSARLQEMARHLAVPVATLERLLQKVQAKAPARPAAAALPAAPAAPSGAGTLGPGTLAERAELDLLACVLAKPELLRVVDLSAETPVASPEVAAALEMAKEGVALGRTASADLLRYLFARAAESPNLLQLFGTADARGQGLAEPELVLQGLLQGRRRLANEPRKRALRQQLQQAMAAGDGLRATSIQQQLLELARQDRPRLAASQVPLSNPSPAAAPAWLAKPPPAEPST